MEKILQKNSRSVKKNLMKSKSCEKYVRNNPCHVKKNPFKIPLKYPCRLTKIHVMKISPFKNPRSVKKS